MSRSDFQTGVAPPEQRPIRRFLLIVALGAFIWTLLLKFYFPGYLDPFVPFHIDHYIYLGDSGEGYGLDRYILHYPRPLGNVLFDLLGRLGIRGMLVPIFLLTLVNAALLIFYLERVTGRVISFVAIGFFFLLVFGNPESYSSVKEDILAVVSLFFTLLIFHLWQSYVEADWGKTGYLATAIILAIVSSYVKETYFATLVLFFAIQSFVHPRKRVAAIGMMVVNAAVAGASLAYNAHVGPFVNTRANPKDPYYQDWHPLSVLHGMAHLLKWLVLPVPALLVLASLFYLAYRKRYRTLGLALSAVVFVAAILLPHSVLPNHLEDQYAWLGAFFFFCPLLLASTFITSSKEARYIFLACATVAGAWTLAEYRKDVRGMAGWLREQEKLQQNLVQALPTLRANVKPGEHELVSGLTLPFDPFRVPGFVRGYFGPDVHWTIVLPDQYPVTTQLTTQMVHRGEFRAGPYDHIFIFDANAHLCALYPKSAAQVLLRQTGFPWP